MQHMKESPTEERMKLNCNTMTRVKHSRSLEFSSSNGQRGEHLPIYGRDEGFLTPNFLKKFFMLDGQ